jgi:DNA-binding transcriptional LysR family regulator
MAAATPSASRRWVDRARIVAIDWALLAIAWMMAEFLALAFSGRRGPTGMLLTAEQIIDLVHYGVAVAGGLVLAVAWSLLERVLGASPGRALTGSVRLTTTMHLSSYLLVPALGSLRARHPGLILEIAADQRAFDLTRREADLALRMGRPKDPGLVTRKLSPIGFRFYGAPSLVGSRRTVDLASDLFVGSDESLVRTPQEHWLSKIAPERRVVFRCNSTAALTVAARNGVGVALLPCFVAEKDPGLVPLDGPEPPEHELWLLVHGELRRSPPVRAVIEWVDELVERARGALRPER